MSEAMQSQQARPHGAQRRYSETIETGADRANGAAQANGADCADRATGAQDRAQHGVTRRGFLAGAGGVLAAGALGATGLSGCSSMTGTDEWLAPTRAHADAEEKVAYTYHQRHCQGCCMLKCTTRDGRLCLVEPNDAARADQRKVCLKAISEIQHIYGDTRIQTPLKRVGERGSGEFEAITWEEAMDIFRENMFAIWDKYGKDAVYFGAPVESEATELANLLCATKEKWHGIDIGYGNGFGPVMHGPGDGNAINGVPELRDWKNANTIMIVGSNFTESTLIQCAPFFDAKEAGAYTIAVDPNFTTTASKCDEWVPIKPAADAAMYLGMISAIIDNGWYDEEYMLAHTGYPFLVSTKTGAILRDHPAVDAKETGEDNPFYVWDTVTKQAKPYNEEGVVAALTGTYKVDGEEYTTEFELLKANQAPYTLQWAEETSGIPAQKLADLAERYATGGPAILVVGVGGNDKFCNSDIAGHAAGVLVALTGNSGKPGTGLGAPLYGRHYAAGMGAWPLPDDMKAKPLDVPVFEMPYLDTHVKAFISFGDQLFLHYADFNNTAKWAKNLEFIVYADVFHTPCVDYADLVLPIATRFEGEEEINGLRSINNHVALRGKVIDPLFEAKTDFMIELEMARALGLDDLLPQSASERARYEFEHAKESPLLEGFTFDDIVANHNVMPYSNIEQANHPYLGCKFPTVSGRLEPYTESLYDFNQALPNWEEANEVTAENPKISQYPLWFCQTRTRFHTHDQFCDSTWIQELFQTYAEMNGADMETRGIADGDTVTIFNDRGEFSCTVRASNSVRPGSVRFYEGEWPKNLKGGNFQNVTNPTVIERGKSLRNGPVMPFNDTLVEVKKA